MAYKKKTWGEKLEDRPGYPKVLKLERGFPCYNALHSMGVEEGQDVVIVNHNEVVDLMRQVPLGKVTTVIDICREIAVRHKVKGCCTLVSGISISTAANAAEEAAARGEDLRIPYWRTLKANGLLNEKFPGGELGHRRLLEAEGHKVIKKGKHLAMEDVERSLFTWR
ncbi:MAG TPA: MGMT family protein [Methanomassiliicoccales archaeon]|jgi:alkylated DNA nucleotide flippase Atl1|nr:MGMT family protein [Methanomassiliicoccales archaeon]